jgi:predicted DNA-binding transcriptional regulator YafY
MSKTTFILRYKALVDIVKYNNFIPFKEIHPKLNDRLEKEIDHQVELPEYTIRTFQRDIKEIEANFGILIEYNRAEKGYFIESTDLDNPKTALLEHLELQSIISKNKDMKKLVQFENRRPIGLEHFRPILKSLESKQRLLLQYQSFKDQTAKEYIIEPYLLKEYRKRWYVLAKDINADNLKTFSLDRIVKLAPTKHSYEIPESFDALTYFDDCFGVIKPSDQVVQRVQLAFTSWQGSYIKTMPLHHSQKVIQEDNEHLIIELRLYVTYDFIMELRSFGKQVRVIKPNALLLEIYNECTQTLIKYDKH